MATSKKITKAAFLDKVNKNYLIPASRELKKGVDQGILPKNCVVLWSNDITIETVKNSKKI